MIVYHRAVVPEIMRAPAAVVFQGVVGGGAVRPGFHIGAEILAARHKIHTVLKIDEGTNLGAVTIRLRSLQSVMKRNLRNNTTSCHNTDGTGYSYERAVFTKAMKEEYTILVPQMSPYHFPLLDSLFIHEGYKFALLPHPGRAAKLEVLDQHVALQRQRVVSFKDRCHLAVNRGT